MCIYKSQKRFPNQNKHMLASFPGPTQLSVDISTEKQGEPGIFSHV